MKIGIKGKRGRGKMYYVYRFINKDEKIIYIGRTENLNDRLTKQHFTLREHLSQDCYKEVSRVEVSELASRSEMKVYELYLINKYTPKYNVQDNNQDEFKFRLPDIEWESYTGKKEQSRTGEINRLEAKVGKLQVEVKELRASKKHVQVEAARLFNVTARHLQVVDYILKRAGVAYDKEDFVRLGMDIGYFSEIVANGGTTSKQEYFNAKGWSDGDRGKILWALTTV